MLGVSIGFAGLPLKSLGFRGLKKVLALDEALKRRSVKKCRDFMVTGRVLQDQKNKRTYRVIGHNKNSALLEALATGDSLVVLLPADGATTWDGKSRWKLQE